MFRAEGSCSEHFHDNEKCEVNVFNQSSVEEIRLSVASLFYFLLFNYKNDQGCDVPPFWCASSANKVK